MTLDEAILEAGRSVAGASPNMTIARFWATVKSLVVSTACGDKPDNYFAVTVDQYRSHLSDEKWPVVVVMATGDTFGG